MQDIASTVRRKGEGKQARKNGCIDLCETRRSLASFLAGEVAQAVIFCFGGAGVGLVVESYGYSSRLASWMFSN